MPNFDCITKENIKKHSKLPKIPHHPYQILIIGGSGSGKTNTLLNLIGNEPDIDTIYLYSKYPYQAKYQLLINKKESTRLKYLNDSNDYQMIWMIFIKIFENKI